MKELIEKNLNYLNNYPIFSNNNDIIKKIVDMLNKDRIIIISGMRWLNKTGIIKEFLEKTQTKNYIYVNDEIDNNNKMKNYWDFFKFLISYKIKNRFCNIIILQNPNKLEDIKNIILELYKSKEYKIIVIWNNIQIDWIEEFEICNSIVLQNCSFSKNNWKTLLIYWNLNAVKILNNDYFKKEYLEWIKNEILLFDVLKPYKIKSIELYNYTITYLALLQNSVSYRELHRILSSEKIETNLKTLSDYIDYAINAKLVKKCLTYDVKNKREMISKLKFYFTDIWLRNIFAWKVLDDFVLIENIIYNNLFSKYKNIYNWINWTYNFSFFIKDNKTYIQIIKDFKESIIKNETSRLNKLNKKWNNIIIIWNLDYIDYNKEEKWVKIIWLNFLDTL